MTKRICFKVKNCILLSYDKLKINDYTGGKATEKTMVEFMKEIKKISDVTDEEAAQMAASKIADSKPKSRMYYKIGATRAMAGSKRIDPKANMSDKLKGLYGVLVEGKEITKLENEEQTDKSIIEFITTSTAVMENIGKFNVVVWRFGNISHEARIKIDTIEGSADEGKDFTGIHNIYTFAPNQREMEFEIEIIDDDDWEPDEEFYLKISLPTEGDNSDVKIGKKNIMTVIILNDDEPGTFSFDKRGYFVKESCGNAAFRVYREDGADGAIEVRWRTIDKTATSDKDFHGGTGVLYFKSGEMNKDVNIEIIDDMSTSGTDEYFEIELYETNCEGAKFGKIFRTTVTIVDDEEFQDVLDNMMDLTNVNLSELSLYQTSWLKQLKNAMCVNGGDLENATVTDFVMHFLTFGLKIIFASCPPPGKAGGWPCFTVSLFYIGCMVLLITDLAKVFGCLVGLKDEVTALTLVTFGISQIDLFASKIAAVNDPVADNSIGNVVAANSIGVFFGLGFPWLLAAIYWEVVDPEVGFLVPAAGLSFQVLIYTICAILGLALLVLRRNLNIFGRAELGGETGMKYVSSAILGGLWIIFLNLASLNAYDIV